MKCKVCGAESGKYPLCYICNQKKETGEIIKCKKCNQWHLANSPCLESTPTKEGEIYLYEVKKTLLSKAEQDFYKAIQSSVSDAYLVFPQINLASFIDRTDNARFRNELFRNVDFLITTTNFEPRLIIEINDQTHLNTDRKERDDKIKNICEEAGIPILKLWTSYGVNPEYIKKRIDEFLNMPSINRIHHFKQEQPNEQITDISSTHSTAKKKNGCYVATCVYGSYDCPEVWILRRFRDDTLAKTLSGKIFINTYYTLSPTFVKIFGKSTWFKTIFKSILDKMILHLQKKGYDDTPYEDK